MTKQIRINSRLDSILKSIIIGWLPFAQPAQAQQSVSVEERFQDVFLTAGYCTAFGAALGTALLAWTEEPTENLKYVAIGASLGFISGSVLGTYVVLAPMAATQDRPIFAENSPDSGALTTGGSSPLVISPQFDVKSHDLVAIRGTYTMLRF